MKQEDQKIRRDFFVGSAKQSKKSPSSPSDLLIFLLILSP